MRVLFTLRGATGHFHPLVPLAQAARDAGHEAAFATAPSFQKAVEGLGFRWVSAGSEIRDDLSPSWAAFRKEAMRLGGREGRTFYRRGLASVLGPPMIADLLQICETWRPDVIVRDSQEYGGCVAAEMLGIPHAVHEAVAFDAATRADMFEPLADLRAAYGLPPDPEQEMPERYLVLSPFPPSLAGVAAAPRPTRHAFRSTPFDRSADDVAPEWPLPIPGAPLIYATLGTVVSNRTWILEAFIAALRDERLNVVVTVGRERDPGQFGP